MKTTYYTARLGGLSVIVVPEKVNVESEAVRKIEIEHREIVGEDEIESGRRVAERGLIAINGAFDETAVLTEKGYVLIERMATGWNQKNGDAELPISGATVRTLPGAVARRFAMDQLIGKAPTEAEIEAISPKSASATGNTQETEPSA